MIITEQGAWCEILFGTEPSRKRFAPDIPLLPTTIRSAFCSSATSRIASAGSPSRANVSTFETPSPVMRSASASSTAWTSSRGLTIHDTSAGTSVRSCRSRASGTGSYALTSSTRPPTAFASSAACRTASFAVSDPSVPTTIAPYMRGILRRTHRTFSPPRRKPSYDRWMATKTRCLAVDDHQVVRQGLEILFGDTDDLELLGTVGSGEDAVEVIKQNEPQIVLMDVRLPGMDGVSTIKRIHEEAPNVQFVVFSAYGDRRLVSDAIAAGARGYVMKGAPPDDLLRAIRTVAVNKPFVDPSLSPMLLMTDAGRAEAQLSEREREILQLLAKGYHTDEVARAIGLSVETVKSDTKRVIGKLQADSRTHAVAIALRQALIE